MLRLVNHLKNAGARFTRQMQPEKIQIADVPPDNYYYAPITQIVAYQIMDLSPQRSFAGRTPAGRAGGDSNVTSSLRSFKMRSDADIPMELKDMPKTAPPEGNPSAGFWKECRKLANILTLSRILLIPVFLW